MQHAQNFQVDLPVAVLDAMTNPVFVKNTGLKYAWVNRAFESLLGVHRADVVGKTDGELFAHRPAGQTKAEDEHVLLNGVTADVYEVIKDQNDVALEILTQKSRLNLPSGETVLLGVMHDLTEVMRTQATILTARDAYEKLASTDSLTGLLDQRAFERRISAALAAGQGLGLLVFSVDQFSMLMDSAGQAAADAALVHFAEIVQRQKRRDDVFARLSDERFGLLLPGADGDAVWIVGQAMSDTVRSRPLPHSGVDLPLTLSVGGLPVSATCANNAQGLLNIAHTLVEQAKISGSDQVVVGP